MATGNGILTTTKGQEEQNILISEREIFDLCGPLHLTAIDWENVAHRRSVAASLVQGVYILERDRQEKRQEAQAFAPPWWKYFQFQLYRVLVDDVDSCIFGAIYKFAPSKSYDDGSKDKSPQFVIAFRGTLTKGEAFTRDLELDVHIIRNGLHQTSRFETAIQAVRHVVATFGSSNIWLTGHSLGAAMAMLAGKTMAKTGVFVDAFLFNPPFLAAPIERIKHEKVKHGIRFATSVITAGLAFAAKTKNVNTRSGDTFVALSAWTPCLYVNPSDPICAEYIGYFQHRERMDTMGAGIIEKVATQHSIGGLVMNFMGKECDEPLHLIPSANLTVNVTPSSDFKEAHGIHQWWKPDLVVESKKHQFT
ncbi:GDSL esterase/lipase At4g10955 [Nicotiana tabacum]|uniref:GDSL esterase/lipase At4g10955 n=1 Tax=Nicotiana tabacum TaxID=4097 RepID=A0A1S4DA43_TOBAC|nr:PREDICTED: GDSL esterase/lipase At4g10955-like [Nicotiana tabacum]